MKFREELPDKCPPSDAVEPVISFVAYRYVSNNPVQESDFDSTYKVFPTKLFPLPCLARGLSIFTDRADLFRGSILKLPTKKRAHICKVTVMPKSGVTKPTGGASHLTWWPYDVAILEHCEVE